jgi:hypothetical protein
MKANSVQLKLELGLSLAITDTFFIKRNMFLLLAVQLVIHCVIFLFQAIYPWKGVF